MKKEAIQTGGRQGAQAGSIPEIIVPVTSVHEKLVKDSRRFTVCKADLMSLANEEDARRSEALIDGFLATKHRYNGQRLAQV